MFIHTVIKSENGAVAFGVLNGKNVKLRGVGAAAFDRFKLRLFESAEGYGLRPQRIEAEEFYITQRERHDILHAVHSGVDGAA
jgi:hypothetical protein